MRATRAPWMLTVLALVALVAPAARAQDDPGFTVAAQPFATYNGGNIDKIDTMSGNLSVDIPLISYPQKGGKLRLSFALHYQSGPAEIDEYCDPNTGDCTDTPYPFAHGWEIIQEGTPRVQITYVQDPSCASDPTECTTYDYAVSLHMSDGSVHQMMPTSTADLTCEGQPRVCYWDGPWRADDGSGYLLSWNSTYANGIVTAPDGTQYYGPPLGYYPAFLSDFDLSSSLSFNPDVTPAIPVLIKDTNGNQIIVATSGTDQGYGTVSSWTDTMSSVRQSIPAPVADNPGDSDPYPCPTVPNQPAVTESWLWDLPGPSSGGGTHKVKFCATSITEQYTYYGANGPATKGTSATELQSVVLPDGTAWQFEYETANKTGDLTKVTFPTGGSLSYGWTSGPRLSQVYAIGDIVAWRKLDPGNGGASGTWQYAYSNTYSGGGAINGYVTKITDPDGNDVVHTSTLLQPWSPYETETQYYNGLSDSGGTLLKTVNTTYAYQNPFGIGMPLYDYALNVMPTQVSSTWAATGQTSSTTYTYDNAGVFYWPRYAPWSYGGGYKGSTTPWMGKLGAETAKSEYDYGGGLIRTTNTSYLFQSNGNYEGVNLLQLPSSVQITTGATQVALTNYGYDASNCSSGTCGNLTSVSRWLNTTGGSVVTTTTYNSSGDPTLSTDGDSNPTHYYYDSGYAGSGPTSATNALNQTTYYTYDPNTGLKTSVKDPNGVTTTYSYDNMLRTTWITTTDPNQNVVAQAHFSYPDATDVDISELMQTGGPSRSSTLVVDGLGREIHRAVTNGESLPYDEVDTCYDDQGRVHFKSYPFQDSGLFGAVVNCTSPDLAGDTFSYDALSRTLQVKHSDDSTVSTSYSGPCATVTDEAGKTRESCTDARGRLTEVIQDTAGPPTVTAYYTHDALDNLTNVNIAAQQRNFVYDSLSRLTSATNPESGTTTYTYDNAGNVLTKADGRGIVTCYGIWNGSSCDGTGYDALNRVKKKTYSDGTPTVTYSYGGTNCLNVSSGSCYNIGHRTGMTDAAGSELWAYDSMGRVLADQRTPTGVPSKTTDYTYDMLGSLTSLTYPSGRTINYTSNLADRPISATDASTGIQYVHNVHYSASGVLCWEQLGPNVTEAATFNSRQQPLEMQATTTAVTYSGGCPGLGQTGTVMDLSYNFNLGSGDNGNVMGITNNRDTTRSQEFTYDPLNRISTGTSVNTSGTNCWSEQYGYDVWGNLLSISSVTGYSACAQPDNLSLGFSDNQITNSGFQYDAAGNLTAGSGASYAYNAENELTNFDNGNDTYTYDGDGHRVKKSNGTLYWYGLGGNVLDESDASGNIQTEYIYFDGRRIARLGVH